MNITITEDNKNTRIDALAALHSDTSRSQWQSHGIFEKDGQHFPGKTKTKIGEIWTCTINIPSSPWKELPAWETDLEILHDAPSYCVVTKPEGISCHPSPSDRSTETLVNALIHHFGDQLAENEMRPGLIHRLDKATSGCLLIAKTTEALQYFQENWPEVEKKYLAVVRGITPNTGTITADIGRHPGDRTKMAVRVAGEGKYAKTSFEKIYEGNKTSTLMVALHTGRTHQIRVHLSSILFPILGDKIYGIPEAADRMLLHAKSLSFICPETQKKIFVESTTPPEFKEYTD